MSKQPPQPSGKKRRVAAPPAARRPAAAAASSAAAAALESSGTESDEVDLSRPYAAARARGGAGGGGGGGAPSDSSSSDGGGGSDVEVEFELYDPRPCDFKSVRRLLERFLPGEEATFDASAMADAVAAQAVCGTTVKVGGEPEDVYGFTTLLPVNKYRVRCSGCH
jgi:hypothetical protein